MNPPVAYGGHRRANSQESVAYDAVSVGRDKLLLQCLCGIFIDFGGEKMGFLTNNSGLMLEKSMNFLWTKQAAILDNIANAETPNYTPKVVHFEESLKERLESAQRQVQPKRAVREVLETTAFGVEEPIEITRMDDNGVNVTEQSAEMIRNAYQIQYVMSAISSDLARLRTAVRGQ